jgi:hypothetical protein
MRNIGQMERGTYLSVMSSMGFWPQQVRKTTRKRITMAGYMLLHDCSHFPAVATAATADSCTKLS